MEFYVNLLEKSVDSSKMMWYKKNVKTESTIEYVETLCVFGRLHNAE